MGVRGGGRRGVRVVVRCCFGQAPAEVSGFTGGLGGLVGTRSLEKRGGDGAGQRRRVASSRPWARE